MMIRHVSRSLIRPNTTRIEHVGSKVAATRSLTTSPWADYAMAPLDPIIGLNEEYNRDDFPKKEIIGVGAYRDDGGKPYVLPCVREAEHIMFEKKEPMEYAGIAGIPAFVNESLKFGYGDDSAPLKEGRIQGVQTLSGTGGLRVMGELLHRHGHKQISVPNPTWGNHKAIFTNSGLKVKEYSYYNAATSEIDFDSMIKDIKEIPEKTAILLHACAHNPTGMDPTLEQWKQISEVVKQRNLLPFFDMAYQGFASGDATKDASALRMFVDDGHFLCTVQSFSKNFGLYGHRVGALSVVGANEEEAQRVVSQLKMVIRPMYSNPPIHGARIVHTILANHDLKRVWENECKEMANRIAAMRNLIHYKLAEAGSTRNWDHIVKQIGMFAFSGLTKDQVMTLRQKHHIYCTLDGRISMAGVTSGNVEYIANAIHDVSK